MIVDDDLEKKIERDGVLFFIAGTVVDFDCFIDSYFAGKNVTDKLLNAYALVVDGGQLYDASVGDDKNFWKGKKRMDIHCAGGTGEEHALTAMDMGATAVEAVKMAMKRDVRTGGKIRTFEIPI